MKANIGIIGAGSWGTAVGCSLGNNGHDVLLWGRSAVLCNEINEEHENKKYLAGYPLPVNVKAASDIKRVCAGKDMIILASPSLYLAEMIKKMVKEDAFSEVYDQKFPVVGVLTKGFLPNENGFPQLIIDVLEEMLPISYAENLVYISGPSHGEEVAAGCLTGLIAASKNPMASIRCREILKSSSLLVYSSLDVIGVQVCAAAKNVIALAFGILDAVSETSPFFADNTGSLLLAAGLNEIQTLGVAFGATHAETFTSIAGVGDLDVTCRSKFGRNRRFGKAIVKENILSKYENLDDLISRIDEIGYLPEGTVASKYIYKAAIKYNLKMPICLGVHKILNKELDAKEFIEKILNGVI